MKRFRTLATLAAVATCVAFLACTQRIDPRLVQRWAASDLDCDERLIVIDDIGDDGYFLVRGCEQVARYRCERKGPETIRCTPERTVARGAVASSGGYVPGTSGCNCGSFGSHDPPAANSPQNPVMPQKPYR